jgi:serine/threonine protein kinase
MRYRIPQTASFLDLKSDGGSLIQIGVLGYGGSSSVKLMKNPKTGEQIAVKVIGAPGFDESHFEREIQAMYHLNHPCILRILGWRPLEESHPAEIQMEFAVNRSLKSVLGRARWGGRPPFWTATGKAIIICGIVFGMTYVHSEGYVHCDLKPANILIDAEGCPLISDFGSCCAPDDGTFTPEGGTARYAAPEMFQDHIRCTASVDVFSFGSILYEILTERPVFPASFSPLAIWRTLSKGDMPHVSESYGSQMQDLIKRCWSLAPEFRPSFHSIIAEFAAAGFDILPGAIVGRVRDFARSRCQ